MKLSLSEPHLTQPMKLHLTQNSNTVLSHLITCFTVSYFRRGIVGAYMYWNEMKWGRGWVKTLFGTTKKPTVTLVKPF